MGLSWDEIRERKRPSQREVPLSLDPQLALAVAEAEAKVNQAREALERPGHSGDANRIQALEEAEEELTAARDAVEPYLVTFKVQALGRDRFEELVDDHKPTSDQIKRWRKENPQLAAIGRNASWNEDTFPPALLAACVIDPDLTESQAKELWNGEVFNQGEALLLFNACLEVNQNHRVVELGKGSRQTARSESESPSVVSMA